MNYTQIMNDITGGLTGDMEKDLKYLMEQAEKYKTHEMNTEILRAIGRIAAKCLPEEKKAEVNRLIHNDLTSYEAVLQEVRFLQHEKKFGEALALTEDLIRKFKDANLFTDDQVSEYHCFNEYFEEVLYRENTEPAKDVRRADIPMDQIYTQYGSILIDLMRPKEAEAALAEAMRWNPADAQIAFERSEACKLQGDLEGFFRLTLDTFKYAFRPKQVARCFRNLGFYFAEKEQWEEAAACFTMSLQYDPESTQAMSELYYIQYKAGKVISPDMDHFRNISEKYGFPDGADPNVLHLSFICGKCFAEDGNTAGARYCWQITYDLTQAEVIRKLIEALPEDDA